MCTSLNLGKWKTSCTVGIDSFGRMEGCPWDQQTSLALRLQDGKGKAFPSLSRWCVAHAKGSNEERTQVEGAEHGKEMVACTL